MASWSNYHREEREFTPIVGKLRCVIVDVQESVSKKGNDMIVITVMPSGSKAKINYWLVDNDHFNRKATAFFDAFPEIEDGDFTFVKWIGCEGAAMFKEGDNGYAEIAYFLSADRAGNLPPFEGEKPPRQTVSTLAEPDDVSDLPFDI